MGFPGFFTRYFSTTEVVVEYVNLTLVLLERFFVTRAAFYLLLRLVFWLSGGDNWVRVYPWKESMRQLSFRS